MDIEFSVGVVIVFFLVINLLAFMIMLIDKIKSQNNKSERISEGMMFFMASVFGSLGVFAGMFVARHKTRKWYFLIGIPALILQNLIVVYFFYQLFSS